MKAKVIFIDPIRQERIMEAVEPPVYPNVGDISETPDGRLWVIVQRSYIPPMSNSMLVTAEPSYLEIRCIIARINDDGTYVDADFWGGAASAEQSRT